MSRIEGVCREVIEKSEWMAIATTDAEGPHPAASWMLDLITLGIASDESFISVPHQPHRQP